MTGFRPGTSPPPVRMAILSLGGTGMSLLAIFSRRLEFDAYSDAGRERFTLAYEKPQGKCGPELQVLGAASVRGAVCLRARALKRRPFEACLRQAGSR